MLSNKLRILVCLKEKNMKVKKSEPYGLDKIKKKKKAFRNECILIRHPMCASLEQACPITINYMARSEAIMDNRTT